MSFESPLESNTKINSQPADPKRLGNKPKLSRRVNEKFEVGMEKTKIAASAGMKKVKEGASVSANWIKVKCNKNKLTKE
ncbi:hypothetical protein RND71_023798 [Anisodus tanguticus]|uniref:Uncharacterized protein n=1 Tax=Anisodus tanguticus TaxID=243964 RepID=A0AAE1RWC9_9SOLA|nr:hypothetical protein RND71_023798 [Anisodus tanguticus]